jgi:hypothetical protein
VATVTLNVAEVEIAPTLVNSSAALKEDGNADLNLLASATDANGNPVTAAIVTQPAHGTVSQNPDGTWTYTPNQYFFGTDNFTYVVSDGTDDSNVATVTLNVAKVEIAPTLASSSATLNEDGSANLNLLASATDVNGDPVTPAIVTQPAHGTVTQNADGTWTYTPEQYFFGTDTFTYVVSDGTDRSNVATVTLTVIKIEIAPTLANSSATLNEDSSANLNLLASATDVNGDPITAAIVTQPAHGTVTQNANGTWTYTPNQYFFGTDTFTYAVSDGVDQSNVATVTLTVNKVEIAPTATNSVVTGIENTPLVLQWSNFAVNDVNGVPLTIVINALPGAGQLQSLQANGQWAAVAVGAKFTEAAINAGSLRFVPAQYASGGPGYTLTGYGNEHQTYAAFGYTVTDGVLSSNSALVSIDITAVATTPTLTLGPTSVSQQLFDTSWEDAPNSSNQKPVLVCASVLDGWNLVTQDHCDPQQATGFEIWQTGDQMKNAAGQTITVQDASGDGSKFLELDPVASNLDTLGISRQVTTIAGASYSLSFDLAGRLGLTGSSTAVSVLLDGKVIATYDPTSPESALNWQHANVSFTGSGGTQTLSIVAAGSQCSPGGDSLVDNIALAQTQQLDVGNQGSRIALQGINAALVDTDGSETLQVVLSGMPVGSTLSDGAHSVMTTAVNPSVNITGWNTGELSITTPASYYGSLTLQATATALESVGGSTASISQDLTVQVNAIARVPTLTLSPPTGSVSRSLIDTSWPRVNNNGYSATILDTCNFAGWSTTPVARGKDPVFEVWANGDQMKNAAGKSESVQAPPGTGSEWLGLSNGVGSNYQAPGIAQSFDTIAGAQYTFNFDYAGQLGLTAANTQIGVYLDGQLLGTYSNVSGNSLNWQTLGFSFKGDGQAHTLSIELSNGTNTSTPRGAMLDALSLIETLPDSASTVYGFAGSTIALPQISDQLAADDPGLLETTLVGLPLGVTVGDGSNSVTVTDRNQVVNITGWNLNSLTVTVPKDEYFGGGQCGGGDDSFNLQVVATSVEPASGSMASIAKNVTVQLLSGQACATPAGVNPYVSYANSKSATQTTGPAINVVASPLVPVSSSYPIVVPTSGNGSGTSPVSAMDLDASLENLLASLSESVGAAVRTQLGQLGI